MRVHCALCQRVGEIDQHFMAAFTCADPKSEKETVKSSSFFHFRDLYEEKMHVNTLVKLTPAVEMKNSSVSTYHRFLTAIHHQREKKVPFQRISELGAVNHNRGGKVIGKSSRDQLDDLLSPDFRTNE